MILYIMNTSLEIVKVIDNASSVIWTRRYYEAGDFEIYIKADADVLPYLKEDHFVKRFDSDMIGVIESVQVVTDPEKGDYITVSGRDLKSLLSRRIVWTQTNVSGTVSACINQLLTDNIRGLNLTVRNYSVTSRTMSAQYTGNDLYKTIVDLCKTYQYGWNITLNDSNQFEFYLYEGVDRSYNQDVNDYVVFSPDFNNLLTTTYVTDESNLKNVALVLGEGEGVLRRRFITGDVSGLLRRELYVDARDITSDTGEEVTETFRVSSRDQSHTFTNYIYSINKVTITDPDTSVGTYDTDNYTHNNPNWDNRTVYFNDCTSGWSESSDKPIYRTYTVSMTYNKGLSPDEYFALLNQRGLEKLAECQSTESLDGDVDSTRQYILDQDFYIGDIVQVSNEYGVTATPRILEIIESEDENGTSVIPTFETWR